MEGYKLCFCIVGYEKDVCVVILILFLSDGIFLGFWDVIVRVWILNEYVFMYF